MPINNPFCNLAWLEAGRSSSDTAKSGVDVVFDEECPVVPRITISAWQEKSAWITEVTTTGFTWQCGQDVATVDWIAIIRNG